MVYSTYSGSTWLGLTFQGTPGGTGCPGNGNTADNAKAWLLTKYIGQGYCCATPPPTTVPTLLPVRLPTTCSQVSTASSARSGDRNRFETLSNRRCHNMRNVCVQVLRQIQVGPPLATAIFLSSSTSNPLLCGLQHVLRLDLVGSHLPGHSGRNWLPRKWQHSR